MISDVLVKDVLDEALSTGASFAEIFLEHRRNELIVYANGAVDKATSSLDYGLGLRIFNGFNAVYAYTNDTSREGLLKMARETANTLNRSRIATSLNFDKAEILNKHIIKEIPFDIHKREKVKLLKLAHESAKAYSDLITQTECGLKSSLQNVLIANSEGLWAEDTRTYSRFFVSAVATKDGEKQTGYFAPGAHSGFEFYETFDIPALAVKAATQAVTMVNADYAPSGKMPVVIGNHFGGVLFHEACGHSLEATSIARDASVFCGKLNTKIASDCLTAIDDGTVANYWGSCNIDDEGTPMQRNVLIENGILKSYLVDKLNGLKMNTKSTGSSRRESYRYAPTSRMTNTYIDNGASTPEEIISSTESGLYAKVMGGGSVNPSLGDFNFRVSEAYMIRNGKIAEPVRGATLIGKGHEILLDIDMVANDMSQGQGMCGSESGSVPTNSGQPMIRIKEMTVGGRK